MVLEDTKDEATVSQHSQAPTEHSKGASMGHSRLLQMLEARDRLQSSARSVSRIGRIYRKTDGEIRPIPDQHLAIDQEPDETQDVATWKDVAVACCCHTFQEWLHISVGVVALLVSLYFFLLGLELLGTAFKVVGGCTAGSLLGSSTNPLANVIIGIIATALLQSSSTTTSIIVSLVSGGLDVNAAIYMVMGANVGTCATAMLVSLAHMSGDGEEFVRAFSGSSVLFVFNFLTLIILFPLELATGYLYKLTAAMLPDNVGEGDKWEGPIKKIISPLGNLIIMANSQLISDVSTGVRTCDSYYPVACVNDIVSADTCDAGLIACDTKTNKCPAFFQDGASRNDDMVSGWVCLFLALVCLIVCLLGLVTLLRKILLGASTRIIYKATNIHPYLAMLVGCGITVLVQSSSITSSALVPLAGVGILSLEQMLPLILGSDIGTTFTALMAALVSSSVQSLQIALVHLFFNVTGVVIWYPLPILRRFLLGLCRRLGKATGQWRSLPIFFIAAVYFVLPLLLLGISLCFEKKTKGFVALGVFLILALVGAMIYTWVWWRFLGGKAKFRHRIWTRQRRSAALAGLADDLDYLKVDMEYVKNQIGLLKDFAGLATVEEGRPVVHVPPRMEEGEGVAEEEEDVATLYESTYSKPWQNVLVGAAHSIGSTL